MKKDIMVVRESIGRVVSMLTRQSIKVTQRGSQAYVRYHPTNGTIKELNVPYLPDDASEEFISAVQGFLDHEVGHVLYSDYKVLQESNKAGKRIANIANILEDVFVEAKMTEAFRGSGTNLESTRMFYLNKIARPKIEDALKRGEKEEAQAFAIVAAFRAWGGQTSALDFVREPVIADLVKPVAEKLGEELIAGIAACKSSADCLALARKFVAKLVTPKPPPPEAPSAPAPKSKDKGEDAPDADDEDKSEAEDEGSVGTESDDSGKKGAEKSDKVADATDAGESDGDKSGAKDEDLDEDPADKTDTDPEAEGEPTAGESDGDDMDEDTGDEKSGKSKAEKPEPSDTGDKKEDEPEDSDDSAGAPSPEPEPDPLADLFDEEHDFSKDLGKSIGDEAKSEIKDSKYSIFSTEWDVTQPAPMANNPKSVDKLEHSIRDHVGVMQKQLERGMAAKARKTWSAGQRRGRIAPGSLFKTAVGDDRVFRQRFEAKAKNTAVSLVIDCSGSMNGGRIALAGTAAFALSSVLERLRIDYEVIGFTSTYSGEMSTLMSEDASLHGTSTRAMKWARIEPIYMPVFKPFSGKLDVGARSRMAHLLENPGWLQQNIDGESIKLAARRLVKQTAERHIMIVLSDGDPCCSSGIGQSEHLKKTVKELTGQGVEVIGIGIQTTSVRNFYPKSVVLTDVNQLPVQVVGELTKMLLAA